MAIVSEGFWPDDIKPSIQTPLAILQPRASELTQLTKGILVGKISTGIDQDQKWVFHHLDVSVPALNNFRQRLLSIRHRPKMIYPAFVDAIVFERPVMEQLATTLSGLSASAQITQAIQGIAENYNKQENEAASDDELVLLLRKTLRADQIKSLLVSLIALANQANAANPTESNIASSQEANHRPLESEEP